MQYSYAEHRHRFAAWAAGRAASRGLKSWKQGVPINLLEKCDVRQYADDWSRLPTTSEGFDELHRGWRAQLVTHPLSQGLGKEENNFTYGRAAKFLNVYLKVMVVNAMTPAEHASLGQESLQRLSVIHPPVDGELLKNISRAHCSRISAIRIWKSASRPAWTRFDDTAYEEVIQLLRVLADGAPLWTLEAYWPGHQT